MILLLLLIIIIIIIIMFIMNLINIGVLRQLSAPRLRVVHGTIPPATADRSEGLSYHIAIRITPHTMIVYI